MVAHEVCHHMAQTTVPVYLSGKLGSMVYTGNRQGTAVRMLVTPKNPETAGQTAQRQRFSAAAKAWAALVSASQLPAFPQRQQAGRSPIAARGSEPRKGLAGGKNFHVRRGLARSPAVCATSDGGVARLTQGGRLLSQACGTGRCSAKSGRGGRRGQAYGGRRLKARSSSKAPRGRGRAGRW